MRNKTSALGVKKNKVLIILLGIFLTTTIFGFGIYSMQADVVPACPYREDIEACYKANVDGKNRDIKAPVCIASQDREKIAYNIILDKKFKEIDDKIKEYLKKLELNKTEYFGTDAKKTLFDALPDLDNRFANPETGFYKMYSDICDCNNDKCDNNIIVKETLSCLGQSTILTTQDYIKNNYGSNVCMSLAKTKLAVFRQIGNDLLKLNKQQVKKDYSKKYMQEQRTKYDDLIEKMSVNKNYINKIDNKWNVKCKDCK